MSLHHISTLPDELLAAISVEGAYATLQDDTLPLSLIVSHVCRRWRSVVCQTSAVWAFVPLWPGKKALASLFLERAQDRQLDICIHAGSTIMKTGEVMNLVRASSSLWRTLCIRVESASCAIFICSRLRDFPEMPLLRHFEMHVPAPARELDMNGLLLPIFAEDVAPGSQRMHWPLLERIVLVGASFAFWSSMFRGLRSLTLAHLPSVFSTPNYVQFRELLEMSPGLQHLKLVGVHVDVYTGYEVVTLPCLRVLELVVRQDKTYVPVLFKIIKAPMLEELSFESGWAVTWDGFDEAVPIVVESYKQLRVLRLNITRSFIFQDRGITSRLFGAFPSLQEFTLNVLEDAQAQYFLQPWLAALRRMTDRRSPGVIYKEVWPCLQLLTVRAPYDTNDDDETALIGPMIDHIGYLRMSAGQRFEVFQEHIFSHWPIDTLDTT